MRRSLTLLATSLSLPLTLASAAPQCGDRELVAPGESFLQLATGPDTIAAFQHGEVTLWDHDGFSWIRTGAPFDSGTVPVAIELLGGKFTSATTTNTIALLFHDGAWTVPYMGNSIYEWNGSSWELAFEDWTTGWGHGTFGSGYHASAATHESGDLIVHGAPGLSYESGVLALLQKQGTTWRRDWHHWLLSGSPGVGPVGKRHGTSVDFDGDFLYAGAPMAGSGAPRGSVMVYEVVGGVSSGLERREAILPSPTGGSGFGNRLAADDGLVVIASPSSWLEVLDRTPNGHVFRERFSLPAPYESSSIDEVSLHAGHLLVELHAHGVVLEFRDTGDTFVHTGTRTDLATNGGRIAVRSPFGVVTRGDASMVAETEHLNVRTICGCAVESPCGNTSASGGCTNSIGAGGRLVACGSTRVDADDLTLTASGLPPGTFVTPLMGRESAGVTLGNGTLCLGGTILRYPVQHATNGTVQIGGLVAESQASHPAASALAAGQTWSFQMWYRDVGGPCGAVSNMTSALTITFTP